MDGLTTLEFIGVVVGIAVGVATILSLVLIGGVRIGRFANREDLTRTSDRLKEKIDDTKADLAKEIDGSNERIDKRFDEVMLAIQNLGVRLENAIMEHTHDEDGVAVFRRHPEMVDADD